ncbi:hypothetical protein LPJ59_000625 [Coemansia sp. RSA 2399]|nr:hypothetical protein LPJ59_000625 [Coemansia sp. RSA 2399]KAJ1907655.1 hypothetical protein LPJ81_000618 [Coemansia sp. IMI 209127]
MLIVSIRSQFATLGVRQLLSRVASSRPTPKGHNRVAPLLHSATTLKARWYISSHGGGGGKDPRRQRRFVMPLWAKPALYVAGSTAVLVFAWPVLRYAIIGGLAYSAYKLVRLWLTWRQAINWGEGTAAVDAIKTVAQMSLQRACIRGDPMVAEMLPGNMDEIYKSITLAGAMDVQVLESPFGAAERVKAVFPVLIEGRESALFVSASGSVGESVSMETLSVYTYLKSGQIVEAKLDVSSDSDDKVPEGAEFQNKKRKAKDAEYKEL